MAQISHLAFVHPDAQIGKDVRIDPFVYIDKDVVIGDRCIIRSHSSILAGTRMGNDNKIYEGCIIGAEPQDFRWKNEESFVTIGNKNVIREHVIINRSIHLHKSTEIGNHSFIMAQTHIGHDSKIGDKCVLGNSVKIAGDVTIDNHTIFSSNSLAHEGCNVGKYVLIKGGCRINGNVPPYIIVAHNPMQYDGINSQILKAYKFEDSVIDNIATAYRYIYRSKTSTPNAIRHIKSDIISSEHRNEIINFIESHNYAIVALENVE